MGVPAQTHVEITDFAGLVQNADPRDLPPGAAEEQVNACCIRFGELQVRRGMVQVLFD